MKHKIISVCLFATLMAVLSGCGNTSKREIPYPDGYTVQRAEETKSAEAKKKGEVSRKKKDEASKKERDGDSTEQQKGDSKEEETETNITNPKEEKISTSNQKMGVVNNFFDTSGSMKRSPEVVQVHSAASKAGAGHEKHYWTIDSSQNLIETDEKLSLSSQYGKGAVIDLIGIGTVNIPIDETGVNVLTTDLQSNTSCTQIGEWLVSTGCTGYSFYVFTMKYEGSLEFKTYTSNSVQDEVSIKDCKFEHKEFLAIVFGNNEMVQAFDQSFQNKLDKSLDYDVCHVSLENEKEAKSFLKLMPSRCFDENVANITYEGTNYCYGLSTVDTEDEEFTMDNTFVFKKSNKSANEDTDAVKAVLYATPEMEVPRITQIDTKVLEYDSSSKAYKQSEVSFTVDTKAYFDGMEAAVDDEELNAKLSGNIVAKGPVCAVFVQNKALPKGLYAVEVQLTCEASGEAAELQKFAASHHAGLEEYSAALKTECIAKSGNGKVNVSKYKYIGEGGDSVFSKLLEFERITDELIAAGAVTNQENDEITLRLIIDNR